VEWAALGVRGFRRSFARHDDSLRTCESANVTGSLSHCGSCYRSGCGLTLVRLSEPVLSTAEWALVVSPLQMFVLLGESGWHWALVASDSLLLDMMIARELAIVTGSLSHRSSRHHCGCCLTLKRP